MATKSLEELKVADEVWIAAALLHRENPGRSDFSIEEIVGRVRREGLSGRLRPGVRVHVTQHCVANRPPNPARCRMLVETGRGRRRLYRVGDPFNPRRRNSKVLPARADIPAAYHYLIDWYESTYAPRQPEAPTSDTLLALMGSGKELWSREGADKYVRRLRGGWE
jgi:hypothetical protein